MFIGQSLSLEACRAAQAQRRSANTATVAVSAAAAAAAVSTAATAATEQASSASSPLFALSPPAKVDYITSPPTPASADGLLVSPVVWRLLSMQRNESPNAKVNKLGGGGERGC